MNEKTVPVISMVRGTNVLFLPDYHYERIWPKKGAKIMVDKEILLNSFYQPGVERMFTEGNLWIDDKATRIELGLETEQIEGDDTPTTNLIVLDDKMLNRICKLMPAVDVKATFEKLSPSQKAEVSDYAVEHSSDLNMERADLLTSLCGVNIISSIQMKKDLEAEE